MQKRLVCFAHGKESGPWGIKITRLAEVARSCRFDVLSPDYSHTHDPDRRLDELLALRPQAEQLVLAGSSMGGYVSAMACRALQPQALFLMAPALYFPGWDDEPSGLPRHCSVIHGWDDEVVPVDRSLRFAAKNRADLHLLEADHSLNTRLDAISTLFEALLHKLG